MLETSIIPFTNFNFFFFLCEIYLFRFIIFVSVLLVDKIRVLSFPRKKNYIIIEHVNRREFFTKE